MAIIRLADTFRSASEDKTDVQYYIWYDPDEAPKACLQLTHGVACYIDRYEELARYFVRNGYAVCGMDNLGHGRTAGLERLGIMPDDGADAVIEDMHTLTGIMKDKFPGLPYILHGHSLGSIYARCYCIKWSDELDGAIWEGSGWVPSLVEYLVPVMQKMSEVGGPENSNKLMADAGNVILDLGIFPPETLLAWLSKDKVNQKLYIADPYNGAPASNSMNRVLIENLSKCSKKDWFKAIRHDLPVFICSGKADPIGLWSWGIRRLFLSCVDHLENMTFKLYDGRHEIHNDFCKDEVYKDLLDFCDEVAGGAYKA